MDVVQEALGVTLLGARGGITSICISDVPVLAYKGGPYVEF